MRFFCQPLTLVYEFSDCVVLFWAVSKPIPVLLTASVIGEWRCRISQDQEIRRVLSATVHVAWFSAAGRRCLAVTTVRWTYNLWTRRGSSHPEKSSSAPASVLCLVVLDSGWLDNIWGRSTYNTSATVWPASTGWTWRTTSVSLSLVYRSAGGYDYDSTFIRLQFDCVTTIWRPT